MTAEAFKRGAMERGADRAASVIALARHCNVSADVVFTAFVSAMAGLDPHRVRLALDAVEGSLLKAGSVFVPPADTSDADVIRAARAE
jgi:hypothetical protein